MVSIQKVVTFCELTLTPLLGFLIRIVASAPLLSSITTLGVYQVSKQETSTI